MLLTILASSITYSQTLTTLRTADLPSELKQTINAVDFPTWQEAQDLLEKKEKSYINKLLKSIK